MFSLVLSLEPQNVILISYFVKIMILEYQRIALITIPNTFKYCTDTYQDLPATCVDKLLR